MSDFGHASVLLYHLEHGNRSAIRPAGAASTEDWEAYRDRIFNPDRTLTTEGEALAQAERDKLRATIWACSKCGAEAHWPDGADRPAAGCGHSFTWDYFDKDTADRLRKQVEAEC